MRKRSKYRPKPINPDPVGYVLKGFVPLRAIDGEVTKVHLKNHAALDAIRAGNGTKDDVDMLIGAANVAEGLIQVAGHGEVYASEIRSMQDALLTMARRGVANNRFLFTGPELTAINLGMEVHDAQLDITTLGELEAAVELVKKIQRTGKARHILQKEPA